MGSFNGWPIVSFPYDPPAPRSVEWELGDTVGSARSPFSLQQQIQNWGASILKASVSYPVMTPLQARAWMAFLASTQGIANVFLFGDPKNTAPQNPLATGGTVTGSAQTGYNLLTSASGLLPGDWFSLGVRLYLVVGASSPPGYLQIWPQLRESPADGTDLVIVDPKGLFRLQKNTRKITENKNHLFEVTFEIEEAL